MLSLGLVIKLRNGVRPGLIRRWRREWRWWSLKGIRRGRRLLRRGRGRGRGPHVAVGLLVVHIENLPQLVGFKGFMLFGDFFSVLGCEVKW